MVSNADHGGTEIVVSGDRLSIRFANDIAEITRMAQIVEDFCIRHGIPSDSALEVTLTLEEVFTNTISYGFSDAGRHEIALTVEREDDEFVIEITDDARAFDPLQVPLPDLTLPVEKRKIGGLGVYLARTLMDAAEYRREDGRNHLRFRKRITPDTA